jgi:hypothetical protein
MYKLFLVMFFSLFIQACATGYRCDLGHDCVDAIEAFELSKVDGGNGESVFVEPDEYPAFSDSSDSSDSSENNGSSSGVVMKQIGMGQLSNKPVYIPDSPMRVWVAPEKYSTKKDGPIYLVDGYNLFGMIKGGWLLGNKVMPSRSVSSSSTGDYGMIEPLDIKKNLGFKPTTSKNEGSSPVRELFR